jgi:hypothetical protein
MIVYKKGNILDKEMFWNLYEKAYSGSYEFRVDPIWTWLNLNNPLNKTKDETNIYLAIDTQTNKIIGHSAIDLQKYKVNNQDIAFSWGRDIYVDSGYRGQGLTGKIHEKIHEENECYIAIAMAEVTRHILRTLGGFSIPCVYTLSRPLQLSKELVKEIQIRTCRTKIYLKPVMKILKRNDKIIAPLNNFLVSLYRLILVLKLRKSENLPENNIVKSVGFKDDDFLRMRNCFSQQFEAYPDDDLNYLKWRFEEHPFKKYNLFIYNLNSKEFGYVILRKSVSPEDNFGIISEIFATTNKSLFSLINYSIKYFNESGCSVIHIIIQHKKYIRNLQKAGFIKTNKRIPLIILKNRVLMQGFKNIKTWFFSFESQDLDFFPNKRF